MNSTNYSIKKALEVNKHNEQEAGGLQQKQPNEDFTFDQLKMVWRQFAFDAKGRALETLYNAMVKREPILLEGNKVKMEVDNQVQIDYISNHTNDLVTFIREHLKNFSIDLECFISKNNNDEVKFLTGKDRFNAMAQKNANLHTFKKVFNLDIEF